MERLSRKGVRPITRGPGAFGHHTPDAYPSDDFKKGKRHGERVERGESGVFCGAESIVSGGSVGHSVMRRGRQCLKPGPVSIGTHSTAATTTTTTSSSPTTACPTTARAASRRQFLPGWSFGWVSG